MDFRAGGHITVSYMLGEGIWPAAVKMIVGKGGAMHHDENGKLVLSTADGQRSLELRSIDVVRCECEAFRDEILGLRDHRKALEYDLRALELVDQAMGGLKVG